MTTASNHIWRQKDRETPIEQARREVLTATAALDAMYGAYDALLDYGHYKDKIFYDRVLGELATALSKARVLCEAYEYYLARCAEAGLTPDQAHTAWQVHSSPAFEAEVVEAESYGPNALSMIDRHVLAKLGLAPHDETGVAPGEDDDTLG